MSEFQSQLEMIKLKYCCSLDKRSTLKLENLLLQTFILRKTQNQPTFRIKVLADINLKINACS